MTRWVFREILALGPRFRFRMRMVTAGSAGGEGEELRNAGMCVIARRLGFSPEANPAALLLPANLNGTEFIPRRNGNPPALRFTLRSLPLVLYAFLTDRTGRPDYDVQRYIRYLRRPQDIREAATWNRLLVGNGDYSLRHDGVSDFIDRLALDASEARFFRSRVLGL